MGTLAWHWFSEHYLDYVIYNPTWTFHDCEYLYDKKSKKRRMNIGMFNGYINSFFAINKLDKEETLSKLIEISNNLILKYI